MRKQAYQYCRGMVWKEVAKRYLEQAGQQRGEASRHATLREA